MSFIDGLGGKFGRGSREVEKEILIAMERQKENVDDKVLVILDGVDFLTAGMEAEVGKVMEMVGEIREVGFSPVSYFLETLKTICGVWI